jgi:putative OPT family oligopeptide transporter
MFSGLIIAWAVAVPILTHLQPIPDGVTMAAHTLDIWRLQVRFIGAGAIGVSAIWTLATLAKPVVGGLLSTIASSRATATNDDLDRDLAPIWIVVLAIACMAVAGWLAYGFVGGTALAPYAVRLTLIAVPFIFLVGFIIAGVAGYMAGLIGASNSPVSGIGILAIVSCASILVVALPPTVESRPVLVAFALFVTAIVFACATISNDNLQDLKTGQLVDATPAKQQWALVIGVIAGAAVIPPILDLLNNAYGFAGTAGSTHEHPLPAPQAGLISALAQGVIQNNIDWSLIQVGALIGVGLIIVDEVLRRTTKSAHMSPLAVGLGIYLPTQSTLMVVVGAIAGWYYDKRAERTAKPESTKQLGVLLASGMIVGEGLLGVAIAAVVAFSGKDFPLTLVSDEFAGGPAIWIGGLAFVIVIVSLYRWIAGLARKAVG